MNVKKFKAGHYIQQYQYRSLTPAPVNHTRVWEDPQINALLENATRSLGELNAFSLILPHTILSGTIVEMMRFLLKLQDVKL